MSFDLRAVFVGGVALGLLAFPAVAQAPRAPIQITLVEGEAGLPVTVLGDVRAEIHQKSMSPKTPSRDLANDELRKQAAKLGADAVVNIKYESYNPMFSKKGFIATGKAVRFQQAPQYASVPPALASQPSFSATGLPSPIPAPAPVVQPPVQSAQIIPAPAPVFAAPPAAPPVVAPPAAAPAPAAAAPAAPGVIALSEQNIARPYTVLGPISAEVTTASLSKTGRQLLDEDLRAQAAKLGADAVVLIKYAPAGPGKGLSAIGVAVKFQ